MVDRVLKTGIVRYDTGVLVEAAVTGADFRARQLLDGGVVDGKGGANDVCRGVRSVGPRAYLCEVGARTAFEIEMEFHSMSARSMRRESVANGDSSGKPRSRSAP